ncbi:hypothetical protein ACHAQJ_002520 [Trichoderma viride]
MAFAATFWPLNDQDSRNCKDYADNKTQGASTTQHIIQRDDTLNHGDLKTKVLGLACLGSPIDCATPFLSQPVLMPLPASSLKIFISNIYNSHSGYNLSRGGSGSEKKAVIIDSSRGLKA